MATWAAFLADPAAVDPGGKVLAPATLDEMRWPVTTTDEATWAGGFGLGLILAPQGKRVMHVCHDGAMPGFLAGVFTRDAGGTVVRMHWATYRFTRVQEGFDGGPASAGPEEFTAG
jgi:hypothetical protein